MGEASPHIHESEGLPPANDPVMQYTKDYTRRVNQAVFLRNSTAYLPSESYTPISVHRARAILRYMDYGEKHKVKDDLFYEGRSKFHEDILRVNLQETYAAAANNVGLNFRLSTTEIDASNHSEDEEHRQGVDVIARIGLYALFGIDHAYHDLSAKQRLHTGIQPEYEMPVIYVSQKDLILMLPDGVHYKNFTRYTDDEGRESVHKFGHYKPFYGLSKEDRCKWRYAYLKKVLEGANYCQTQLERAPDALRDALDISRVMSNLGDTIALTRELMDRLEISHPQITPPYPQRLSSPLVYSSQSQPTTAALRF